MDNLSGAIPRFINLALRARDAIETAIRMDTPPASGKPGSEERQRTTEYLEARAKWNAGFVEDMPFTPRGETLCLLDRLQPTQGYSELQTAYQRALAETFKSGLGVDIRQEVKAVWKTHCDLLDVARRKAEARLPDNVDVGPFFDAHNQALLPLMDSGRFQANSAEETPANDVDSADAIQEFIRLVDDYLARNDDFLPMYRHLMQPGPESPGATEALSSALPDLSKELEDARQRIIASGNELVSDIATAGGDIRGLLQLVNAIENPRRVESLDAEVVMGPVYDLWEKLKPELQVFALQGSQSASKDDSPPSSAPAADTVAGQTGIQHSKTRKRATKGETLLKLQAAMVYKMEHPGATNTEVSREVKMPRSTLEGKEEWPDWCLKVERANNGGRLESLKAVLDKRTGDILAYRDTSKKSDLT